MQRILLAILLVAAAFSSFVSLPATAAKDAISRDQQATNKTEDGKTHRQQHRQQILNK
ncbi:MAG: hypothetical protein KME07_12815 [Pegethrix bostrychoides GSE-TBD4-15B]|jgi:hypothetical protein|uniref:Uncharacterized protein n=1 Tax=Pegethrix bostrychoides GSE-TBD4-15B TaxID=2839662 RepID=A0A951PDA9_9CYAN|nr:hypothetical protein [Pegethrix bostrychoides GSE-TBD4-15B]